MYKRKLYTMWYAATTISFEACPVTIFVKGRATSNCFTQIRESTILTANETNYHEFTTAKGAEKKKVNHLIYLTTTKLSNNRN
jgi:hypothetical protein